MSVFPPCTLPVKVMYAVTGMPRAPCATKKTNGSITATDNAPISGSNGSSNGSGDSNGNGDRAGDGDADRVAGGAMGGEETEAKRRALYDLKSRQRMQFMMDVSSNSQVNRVSGSIKDEVYHAYYASFKYNRVAMAPHRCSPRFNVPGRQSLFVQGQGVWSVTPHLFDERQLVACPRLIMALWTKVNYSCYDMALTTLGACTRHLQSE